MAAEIVIRPFEIEDEPQVVAMWQRCGLVVPWNDPHRDIRRKLAVQPDLLLVGEIDGAVGATAMVGYDGHRGWINYLAVLPEYRGYGYGRAMVAHAEGRLKHLGCPKINLQVRSTNFAVQSFYEHLGYVVDPVVNMGKRLIDDT